MQEPLERKEPRMPPQPAPQKDEAPDPMNQASFGSRREQIGREILAHIESQVSQFEALRLIEAKTDRRELVPALISLAFNPTTDKIVAAAASGHLVSISRDMTSETIGTLRTKLSGEAFLAAYNRRLDPSVRGAAAEIFSNTGDRACADFSLGLLRRDEASPDPHRDNQNFLQGVIRAANAVHDEKTNLYAERVQPALAALLKEPGLSGSNIELIAGERVSFSGNQYIHQKILESGYHGGRIQIGADSWMNFSEWKSRFEPSASADTQEPAFRDTCRTLATYYDDFILGNRSNDNCAIMHDDGLFNDAIAHIVRHKSRLEPRPGLNAAALKTYVTEGFRLSVRIR